ncbi:hypothetical protein [Microbacterium sp.]|uniref:hypothetical protein n=1 Tax=Microbacterium sp. TaxID=51671 RepID=UPI0032423C5C
MSEFTASNGLIITEQSDGVVIERLGMSGLHRLYGFEVAGLREFFQKENDDRLGRWRWSENPDYVVYLRVNAGIRVVSESSGDSLRANREAASKWKAGEPTFYGAARAYFDAHPEPKPAWHDAKPGEVWVVKFRTGPTFDEQALVVPESGWDHNLLVVDARRIWPEVVS